MNTHQNRKAIRIKFGILFGGARNRFAYVVNDMSSFKAT
jgi:hypothetical protein